MTGDLAQDPDELFDVVTPDGIPTGVRKRRADVHRDGDWHAAIHIWVVRMNGDRGEVLFQRRSPAKDTFGGKLDATVGGHLGAGEMWKDALRESVEEIGVAWPEEELRPVGVRLAVSEISPIRIDREVQFVFLVRDDRPLLAYEPNPVELAGLVAIPIDALLDLWAGFRDRIDCEYRKVGREVVERASVSQDDFPAIQDRYYYRVGIAARSFLNQERHVTI